MFQKMLNDYLLEQQELKKTRESSGKVTPSSLGQCYLRQYWKIKKLPTTDYPDLKSLKNMERGKIIHKFMQNIAEKNGYQVEVKVETPEIIGYADLIKDDTVADIKTQDDWAFKWHYQAGFDSKKEKPSEWLQVACYGWLLCLPKIKLIFVNNKDVSQIQEYEDLTVNWLDKLSEEIKTILSYTGNEIEPENKPRLYLGKDGRPKECRYCQYRSHCQKTRGTDIEVK